MSEQPSESFTQGSVTYKRGADGKWYFHVKGKNGEIVAQSEGYERVESALKGVAALTALLTDQGTPEIVEMPDDGA